MLKFDLNADEYVVMKSDSVAVGGSSLSTNGLVLTNQCLMLVSRGVFGRHKGSQRFPLATIKVIDGKPQAIASENTLEVYFKDRQEHFEFATRKEAKTWSRNLCALLEGKGRDPLKANDKAIPGVEYVAEALKDSVDALKRPFRPRRAKALAAKPCGSCGAPLSGTAHAVVACDHCGSSQKLPKR